MKNLILPILMASTVLTGAAFAHEYKIGDLVIDHPVSRATLANAPVGGGYMTIRNMGNEADTLLGGASAVADKVEVHEMSMDGDVMKMRELSKGLEIPAGGEVKLMPGGFHIMFMGLNQQLIEGEEFSSTLTFEKAGTVEVNFSIENLHKIREHLNANSEMNMDHSGHGDMMKHDQKAQ